ncbi:DUF4352 domain-containing protein [Bacillus sp. Y1]|nr:DUF4352 domain-containing protein [Bacillus sp. Y1]AYA78025.1 DUF4352 domain-containing protein [Bacillus sp. Y1]
MNRLMKISILLLSILSLVACGSEETNSSETNESKNTKQKEEESGKLLTEEEFTKMFSDPKKYKGSKVEYFGRIFTEPEKDDEGTYLQVFADDNDELNTIVAINDPNLTVKTDDIIHITGTVTDVFKGENLMGGTIVAPAIKADKIEISDYATAFAPAIKTIDVNQEMDQHGYLLKLNKIELAENETRAYVTITNNTQDTISFYTFNTKLVVGNTQYEENNEFNYPEIQSDILPGVTTEGIIVFPVIPESRELKIFAEGSSENYELDFTPFEFTISY